MLKIINNLSPFFEDCYRRISVREYAKITGISPPTSSKLLVDYWKEVLLKKEEDRNYKFFYADKQSDIFTKLSGIYWSIRLNELTELIKKSSVNPAIILFGSLAKAEVKIDSDIDIAIISSKKEMNLKNLEKKLKRNIHLLWIESIEEVKNKEMMNNIINGIVLYGRLKI